MQQLTIEKLKSTLNLNYDRAERGTYQHGLSHLRWLGASRTKRQALNSAAQVTDQEDGEDDGTSNESEGDWMLMGETTLCSRPINSLLEEDLEFDRTMKAVPVVTEESVQTLEDGSGEGITELHDPSDDDSEDSEKHWIDLDQPMCPNQIGKEAIHGRKFNVETEKAEAKGVSKGRMVRMAMMMMMTMQLMMLTFTHLWMMWVELQLKRMILKIVGNPTTGFFATPSCTKTTAAKAPKKPPSESRNKTSKVWFHDQGNTVVLMESRLVWVENETTRMRTRSSENNSKILKRRKEGDMDDEEDHCLVYRSLLELFKEDFAPIHILGQFNHRFIIAHRVALNKHPKLDSRARLGSESPGLGSALAGSGSMKPPAQPISQAQAGPGSPRLHL
ncbi:hypothetical protein JB92DRAFT_3309227 [Gautieria morchelliformis]|nr:hypothetical protein JB92DRAFT_3309227 [Gautieria morchelliformis]